MIMSLEIMIGVSRRLIGSRGSFQASKYFKPNLPIIESFDPDTPQDAPSMESRLRDALTKWGFTAEEGEQALVTFVCARAVFSCACAVGTETKHRPSAAASTITLDVYGTAKARLYSMFQEIGLSKGDSQSMAVAMLTEGLAPPGTDAKSPATAAENTPLDELFPDDFVHHGQQATLVKNTHKSFRCIIF